MILATAFTCAYLIWKTWSKWDKQPVIITVDDKISSVSHIPFPAVTICPEAKVNKNKFNIKDYITKDDSERKNKLKNLDENE